VSRRLISPWRIASVVVVLGLLGSVIVTLALVDSPARPAAGRRTGQGADPSLALQAAAQAPQARAGQRLLAEAAAACQDISYHGVQIVAWWGEDGASTSVVEVWHLPGHGTMVKTAATDAEPFGALQQLSSGRQDPDGILGISGQLLVLLQANYEVIYAGAGTADNRPAQIVEVRRPSGGLAARFWLDAATKLPLRRETFDTNARVSSEDAFINLTVGEHSLAGAPTATIRPWSGRLSRPELASLRADGWPLPRRLPGNLLLFASNETSTSSGEVVDLSYSDGLSVVSLFVQQGVLPRPMPGWRPVTLSGRPVYAADPEDQSLAWSARGYVFTVIGNAPAATVADVVAALPHDEEPGFWTRLGHGFRRIVSWANPFG